MLNSSRWSMDSGLRRNDRNSMWKMNFSTFLFEIFTKTTKMHLEQIFDFLWPFSVHFRIESLFPPFIFSRKIYDDFQVPSNNFQTNVKWVGRQHVQWTLNVIEIFKIFSISLGTLSLEVSTAIASVRSLNMIESCERCNEEKKVDWSLIKFQNYGILRQIIWIFQSYRPFCHLHAPCGFRLKSLKFLFYFSFGGLKSLTHARPYDNLTNQSVLHVRFSTEN